MDKNFIMKDVLHDIEMRLSHLLLDHKEELHSMYIDYHQPFVKRIWFQSGKYRIYLHKIESCDSKKEALFHPHPWDSVIRIVKGAYEMGIGHSENEEAPVCIDSEIMLAPTSVYTMTEKNGWHYVSPLNDTPSYSLMVTANPNGRVMPIEPKKEFRKLDKVEIMDILDVFDNYYNFHEGSKISICDALLK